MWDNFVKSDAMLCRGGGGQPRRVTERTGLKYAMIRYKINIDSTLTDGELLTDQIIIYTHLTYTSNLTKIS